MEENANWTQSKRKSKNLIKAWSKSNQSDSQSKKNRLDNILNKNKIEFHQSVTTLYENNSRIIIKYLHRYIWKFIAYIKFPQNKISLKSSQEKRIEKLSLNFHFHPVSINGFVMTCSSASKTADFTTVACRHPRVNESLPTCCSGISLVDIKSTC